MKVEIKGYIVSNDDKCIYDYFGIGATCPQDILNAIHEANSETLEVEITTCYGGDIFAGSSIYAALRGYAGGVRISVTGLAASAASVIAMAGQSEMAPTAMMMVHRVSSIAAGNYHDMERTSNSLQQADKAIAAAYVAKSGMEEKDAIKMMDAETWITAKQAVELGLVDRVSEAAIPQLVNAYGGMLPRAVVEKTRAMLAVQKTEPPKGQPDKAILLAKAKLSLAEKAI